MNATERPVPGDPENVRFGNGNDAVLYRDDGADPSQLLAVLGIQSGASGRPVIVVCGGADSLKGAALTRAEIILGTCLSAVAEVTRAVVVNGGTASGVMAVTGAVRARQPDAMPVLLGVAPAGQVTYPGQREADRVALEENHSHFVLAHSSEWGGETRLLIAVAAALAGGGRPVMLLAGGGLVAKAEVLEAVRQRWPVFVIEGTGGLAEDILQHQAAPGAPRRHLVDRLLPGRTEPSQPPALSSIEDADLREIVGTGNLRTVSGIEPEQQIRQLCWELQDEPVLKGAWQEFATYDYLAKRLRTAFTRFQMSILLLGVLATLLALIYSEVHKAVLHWLVVAIPILVSVLIALASRHAVGQRWVMLRAAAEAIKSEIYRYRTRSGPYRAQHHPQDHAARQRTLSGRIDALEAHLMQTEVSSGQLTPYSGPLPPQMYGAGRDDDGLSPLDAERYLQIRVSDQLDYYRGRVRRLTRQRSLLQLIAIASGGVGALLAAAGLDIWVGLTGGIAAAALAYMGYLQVNNTIVTYNQAATKLGGREREWKALTSGQRGRRAFADLVARAEDVLTTELAGWVQQMNDAMRELKDREAGAARRVEPGQAGDRSSADDTEDPSITHD